MKVFQEWTADRSSSYINISSAIECSKYFKILSLNFGGEISELAVDTWIRAWSNKNRKTV